MLLDERAQLLDLARCPGTVGALDPDRVLNVNHQMTKGVATFRIKAKMTGETFVEHLVEGEFANMIEVIDLKANRIQAKKKGG